MTKNKSNAHSSEISVSPLMKERARRAFFVVRGLALLLVLLVLACAGLVLWARDRLAASLPQTEGVLRVSGLAAPALVERDALGVPTLSGSSRQDVAFATGFVHAQDRFFQMDLLRRRSAGELSEIFGERTLASDRSARLHLFRRQARRVYRNSPLKVRALLEAYAAGVNEGLASLGEKPFEYILLHAEPQLWIPEDCVLVLLSMFVQLQDEWGEGESAATLMRETLPDQLAEFLLPPGTEWDAPLLGEAFASPPVPGPEVFNLHDQAKTPPLPLQADEPVLVPGSNGWAVAGTHTADGSSLLANELHLGLSLPNLWYRASLLWPDPAGGRWRVTGATLPGLPIMVVGSNGRVAWGITNSVVDTSDIILLEVAPGRGNAYRVPGGLASFEYYREILRAKGGRTEALDVVWTKWGPLTSPDSHGRRRAVRWVAHEPGAVGFEALALETARTLESSLAIANRSGVPALNFVVADSSGRIGWTILGRVPQRIGFTGSTVGPWWDGDRRWQGLLEPDEVPRIVDPPVGRIWIANSRTVDGEQLARLGDGGYLLGARARQIRDSLLALDCATPEDMRRLQLDDRALFLQRWRDLLLAELTPRAVATDPRRSEFRRLVESWGGHAAVNSAGYRMVRRFRMTLARQVFEPLTAVCRKTDPEFDYLEIFDQMEGPLWRLVAERPLHLLRTEHRSWTEQILAAVDEVVRTETRDGRPLSERTWGERNTVVVRHPLSPAFPGLGRWLDMPAYQLPGDEQMPRVQHPEYGATLRIVVSPGREGEGYFQMPGGESGHPLSSHYRDAHTAWTRGEAAPFLPGPPVETLKLLPNPVLVESRSR